MRTARDRCPAAELWGLPLDQRSLLQRRKCVKARRSGRQGVLGLDAREVDWFEPVDLVDLTAHQCEAKFAGRRARGRSLRYATFGFSDEANLDEGAVHATSFALKDLTAAEEAKTGALVKKR